MVRKTMNNEEVLKYLTEYLIMVLDELTETVNCNEFIVGEITAFVECLEILNKWSGFIKYGIADIGKKYQIQ